LKTRKTQIRLYQAILNALKWKTFFKASFGNKSENLLVNNRIKTHEFILQAALLMSVLKLVDNDICVPIKCGKTQVMGFFL